jgi:muramoyltetrapeptide carboxypeptidase
MTLLTLFSPAGVLVKSAPLTLAAKRLKKLGFDVTIDDAARARHQRFAGDDDTRLAALHRVATQAPSITMATRGGYGLTRLLDRIDWKLIARSIEHGTRWVGHSDMTTLQLALLAKFKHSDVVTWAGPLAADDFGRADDAGGVDEITRDCFLEAMSGALEAVGFRTEAGFDGLEARGTLWGGNLCMVNSMLGTKYFPRVKGGILAVAPSGRARRAKGHRARRVQCVAEGAAGSRFLAKDRGAAFARVDKDSHPHRIALRPRAYEGDCACRGESNASRTRP